MKENLNMQTVKFKKGITLIEVLISMLLIFIVIFSFTFVMPKIYSFTKEQVISSEENIFIDNSYQIFSSNPIDFKKNLNALYNTSWIDDNFYYHNIILKFEEDENLISVVVVYNGRDIEKWKRKKVIQ